MRLLNLALRDASAMREMSEGDLDLTIRLARKVRLLGRFACDLEESGELDRLPAAAVSQFTASQTMAASRARLARWELNRIARAVSRLENTDLVVLKGCAYLILDLPNAAGRLFADVDLMTDASMLELVERNLNDFGWRTTELSPYDDNYYRRWTHELPPMLHEEREVEIDLHHNIVPRTARLKPPAYRFLESSRLVPETRFRVLSNEDMTLHAMTHLMFDSDLADKLRDLVDIGDLIQFFSVDDPLFWDRLTERAEEMDLRRPAFYSIRYIHKLLHIAIPDRTLRATAEWAPPAIITKLMDRLVPQALFPGDPDHETLTVRVSRFLLYVRSHWIRMPPWLLFYHLSYKFVVTRLQRRAPTH